MFFPIELKKTFKIVIVDGRARIYCLKVGWQLLDNNGVMILHDAQRKQYNSGIPDECYWLRTVNPDVICEDKISTIFIAKSHDVIKKIGILMREVLPDSIEISNNLDGNGEVENEGGRMNNISSVQGAYDNLWEEKLNDPAWLKNDGKGRVEFCAGFLKAHSRIGQGAKILDIGCGRGTLAHYLDSEVCLYGIDISEKAISETRKVYKKADVVDLNMEKLPYEDNFFDCAITLDVIEHVFDPLFFLKEIHRVLKIGSEIILSTPNILNENLLKSLVHTRRFPKTSGDPFPYDGGHIHFFTYRDIFDLMKSVGFNFTPIGPLKDAFDYEFKEPMAWVSGKKI